MKIWNSEVGPGHPVFVVAEGGSCHGGSLEAALALTDAAADAGANAMKWQLWLSADEMYDRAQFPAEWESADRFRLPAEWLPQLRDRAHERGMAFGLSSFGFASLDEADKWVDFHKVASIESRWRVFVHAVWNLGKPTFVSLGMRDSSDVMWSLAERKFRRTVWLQCTVAYPCDLEDADVRFVQSCPDEESAYLVGLSDHTLHPTIAPCAAVALGASVIEKHLKFETITRESDFPEMSGTPDEKHSIDQREFHEMVQAIRLTEKALGSSEKRIRPSEEPYLKYRRGPRGLRGA